MKISKCKGCGKDIVWAKDLITSKNIPLDAKAPVYEFGLIDNDEKHPVVRRATSHYVSHFSTCSKANDFSAARKRRAEKTLWDAQESAIAANDVAIEEDADREMGIERNWK